MIKDKYSRVVYFDTETTGFDPEKHQIIEFAAVVCDGNESRDEDFFVRLRREDSIPEKITQITGITDLDLVHGKEEEDLIQCFKDLCSTDGQVLLVAHNAQFDLGFIAQTMIRYKDIPALRAFNSADYLDTLTVYKDRASLPHRLKDAITHYGLDGRVQNTHRAIDDAKALKAVCDAMEAERDDLLQYINVFGYSPKYGISGKRFKKIRYQAQDPTFMMRKPEEILPKLQSRYGGN